MSDKPNGLALLRKGLPLNLISKYRNALFGIAILWIVIHHGAKFGIWFGFLGEKNVLSRFFVDFGDVGVDMFLFLSGMGLYFSFVKNEKVYPFLQRRLSRVLPAFLIICGTTWAVRCIVMNNNWPAFLERISLMRFWLKGSQQIWFINFILVLYVLYPYLYHFLFDKSKYNLRRAVILIAAALLFNFALQLAYPEFWASTRVALTRIPVAIFGCYFGKLVYDKKKLSVAWILIFILLGFIAFYLRYYVREPIVFADSHDTYMRLLLGLGGVCFCYTFAIVFELVQAHRITKVVLMPLSFLGGISLELYLAHMMLRDELYVKYLMRGSGRISEYLMVVAAAIVVAALTHFLVSKWSNVYARLKENVSSI